MRTFRDQSDENYALLARAFTKESRIELFLPLREDSCYDGCLRLRDSSKYVLAEVKMRSMSPDKIRELGGGLFFERAKWEALSRIAARMAEESEDPDIRVRLWYFVRLSDGIVRVYDVTDHSCLKWERRLMNEVTHTDGAQERKVWKSVALLDLDGYDFCYADGRALL